MRRALLVSFLCVFAACPSSQSGMDMGNPMGNQPPSVSSILPDRGPLSGGTTVTVNGSNFLDGAVVKFGEGLGTQVMLQSKRKLTVVSPATVAPGAVAITVVNPDGQNATLLGAFTYESPEQKLIDQALVVNPLSATDSSGAASPKVTIVGHVSVTGVTKGAGQGAGVKAQVGVAKMLSATPAATDFTWSDAAYAGDVDGLAAGDLARDAYQADVMVPAAMGVDATVYRLAARFSIDDGATWVLADHDGSANGVQEAQLPTLTVSRATVDWCKLGGEVTDPPPVVKLKTGDTGPTVYGQVYRAGVTPGNGAGAGIAGQLGYGAPGTDPAGWTWVNATFSRESGNGQNDEFQAALPTPAPGDYRFAFRFGLNGGPWKVCDADGTDLGGFTEDQAGVLTVSGPGVDSCVLQYPSTLEARVGRPSGTVYGRVYAKGITEAMGAGTGISGDLGVGPAGSLPDAGGWTWTPSTYNVEAPGGWEEYQASLTGPAAGSFAYAYRFKHQSSPYTYCDLDTSDNGYSPAQAGSGTSAPVGIDECVLEGPLSLVAPTGTAVPAVSVRVKALTVTDLPGQGAGVTAEVGYGPKGSNPSTWSAWSAAAYSADVMAFDRYAGGFTAPANGTYDVAVRVRYQSGAYAYCDGDGSANGYQSAQAAQLTVAPAAVSACKLQFVDKGAVASGDPVTAYGRVRVPGLSEKDGGTPGLRAQFGVGTAGTSADTNVEWGWAEAPFFTDITAAQQDEYALTFQPAYNGSRAVSFRVSLNNGASWTYCDLDGSDVGGYSQAQQAALTVNDHADLNFCNLQFPSDAGAFTDGGARVYGQLFVQGETPNAAATFVAQVGIGQKVEDPGLAWSWTPAAFNVTAGNNNEYTALLVRPVGNYRYAFRYSRDGGSWCYGDLDGNGKNGTGQPWGGFYGDAPGGGQNLGQLTVSP
ncbi:MAG: IPT/TIG domain-containing protein [Myxococcaceae bacterium]|nr:IPT/TIG domain-containing protein [Myxococcaceae bacterium]